jgi:prepilin-type N-terminal cleavage/methylation domain-containing protein
MTRRAAEGGFSLAELLVAVALLALFAAALPPFVRGLFRAVRVLELASEAQQSARIGAHLLVRDLRGAGFAPAVPLRPAVRGAEPSRVRVASDLNGDGDTDDANERIEYRFDAERRALLRVLGDAPAQPMLMDVAALDLTYFAADGAALPLSSGAVEPADLARIRRIDVVLAVAIPLLDWAGAAEIRAHESGTVFLRNG